MRTSKLLPTEVKADLTVNVAIGVLLDEARDRERLIGAVDNVVALPAPRG